MDFIDHYCAICTLFREICSIFVRSLKKSFIFLLEMSGGGEGSQNDTEVAVATCSIGSLVGGNSVNQWEMWHASSLVPRS